MDKTAKVSADKYPCRSYKAGGVLYEFYRHPYLFRLSHIIDWADEYEEFGLPEPKIKDCHPIWIDLMKIYKYTYNSVLAQVRKEAASNG